MSTKHLRKIPLQLYRQILVDQVASVTELVGDMSIGAEKIC